MTRSDGHKSMRSASHITVRSIVRATNPYQLSEQGGKSNVSVSAPGTDEACSKAELTKQDQHILAPAKSRLDDRSAPSTGADLSVTVRRRKTAIMNDRIWAQFNLPRRMTSLKFNADRPFLEACFSWPG